MNDLDADFDEYIRLLEENKRLKGLVAAYENDLVLVDVAEKLTAAEEEVERLREASQELYKIIVDHGSRVMLAHATKLLNIRNTIF